MTATAATALPVPDAPRLLTAVLELGRELHLEAGESDLVGRFLATLGHLFPGRAIGVRVLDVRSPEPARCYVIHGALRDGVEHDRIVVKESAVAKTRLKTAITAAARVRLDPRWDSPFRAMATGFVVPLVASGELYGVLDVGYGPGIDASPADEPLILPIANHLSVALRNLRLHRESIALRDYQARLIEHANALIVGIDRNWRITVCNRALFELLGMDRDELVGRDLRDLLPADQRPRLTRVIAAALRGDHQDAVDLVLTSRRLGRVATVWTVAAIGGSGRQIDAVVAIGQDQSKLQELQDQVIQAERLATLGQLAAGVVHELNNPLTSITVYAEYLLRKAERTPSTDDGDLEKLRRIAAGAQRIMRFARELVEYARPVGSEVEVVDLNGVVRQALSFCDHLFDPRDPSSERPGPRTGIELHAEYDAELPPLYAVPGQLEQVLINLVTNAAHAVEGGGVIEVRTYQPGPGEIAVEVRDSGGGIAAEDLDRIFEPFFTTKVDGKGTGLGLSIVRNIVDQHQGRIRVSRSALGGAGFQVVLPAAGPGPDV